MSPTDEAHVNSPRGTLHVVVAWAVDRPRGPGRRLAGLRREQPGYRKASRNAVVCRSLGHRGRQGDLVRALNGLETLTGTVKMGDKGHTAKHLPRATVYLRADRHDEGLRMTLPVRENAALATLGCFRKRRLDRPARVWTVGAALEDTAVKTASQEAEVSALSGGNQQKFGRLRHGDRLVREGEVTRLHGTRDRADGAGLGRYRGDQRLTNTVCQVRSCRRDPGCLHFRPGSTRSRAGSSWPPPSSTGASAARASV